MLRARNAMLILVPALLAGTAACGGEDASEESTGNDVAALSAASAVTTAPSFFGTFRAERAYYGIAVLTLKKDYTFHLEEGMDCVRAPCIRPEIDGIFKTTIMNGVDVLMLFDPSQGSLSQVEYLRYALRGDVLYVAPLSRYATWQALPRSEQAWCDVRSDCELQNLPTGDICAGQWYCATASNVCQYACGPVTCDMENTCPDR